MSVSVTVAQEFELVECAQCCMAWAMSARFVRGRRNDHKNFYCPNGHLNIFKQQSEAEKLRVQLAAAEAEKCRLLEAGKRLAARVQDGVCPCCNRHFANMQKHMASKHPKEVRLIA